MIGDTELPGDKSKPGVILADAHRLVAECIGLIIRHEFQVLDVLSNGDSLRSAALRLRPDIIISEIELPGSSGLQVLKDLRSCGCLTSVIFVTRDTSLDLVETAICLGAQGVIRKTATADELRRALRLVLAGEVIRPVIEPDELRLLLRRLPPRRRQVAKLIAEGKSSRQIADLMKLSVRSVEGHKAILMELLDTPTSYLLARRLEELGLRGDPATTPL